jgi:hypothetical protein
MGSGLAERYEIALRALGQKDCHSSERNVDKEFLRARLRDSPSFALSADNYYIRIEDRAAVELVRHLVGRGHLVTGIGPQQARAEAEMLIQRLLGKHADLPIPNVGLMALQAQIQEDAGRTDDARATWRSIRNVLDSRTEWEPWTVAPSFRYRIREMLGE